MGVDTVVICLLIRLGIFLRIFLTKRSWQNLEIKASKIKISLIYPVLFTSRNLERDSSDRFSWLRMSSLGLICMPSNVFRRNTSKTRS